MGGGGGGGGGGGIGVAKSANSQNTFTKYANPRIVDHRIHEDPKMPMISML